MSTRNARQPCARPRSPSARPRICRRRYGRVPEDADTGAFYFIEVNPRIQVEHTSTEQVTGLISSSADQDHQGVAFGPSRKPAFRRKTGSHSTATRSSAASRPRTRKTTSSRYGRITAYRAPSGSVSGSMAGPRIRCGRHPLYDPLLEKVTAWAHLRGSHRPMDRGAEGIPHRAGTPDLPRSVLNHRIRANATHALHRRDAGAFLQRRSAAIADQF